MRRQLILAALLILGLQFSGTAQNPPARGGAERPAAARNKTRVEDAYGWPQMSKLRWNSFSVYSLDVAAGYSNYPLNGDSQAIQPGVLSERNLFLTGGAYMGYLGRTPTSDLAVTYSPHFYQQSASHFNSVTHNAQIRYRRSFGRRWSAGMNGGVVTSNRFSTIFDRGAVGAMAPSQMPLANQDTLSLVSPAALASTVSANLVLAGFDVMTMQTGIDLTGEITDRTRIFFNGSFAFVRTLDADENHANQFLGRRSLNRTFAVAVDNELSRRFRMGLRYTDDEARNSGLLAIRQRAVEGTLGWLPARKWSVFAAAGPVLRQSGPGRQRADLATQIAVSRSTSTTTFSFAFQRDLYLGGLLPGGMQAHNAGFRWIPRSRGRHWSYSLNAGYTWVKARLNSAYSMSGWLVQPELTVPLSRSLAFYAHYSFFARHCSTVSLPLGTERHMAVVGFRWTFQAPPNRGL